MDLSIKDYVLSNDYSLMMLFHFLPCLNCISLNYAYPYSQEDVYTLMNSYFCTYFGFVLARW
jgi:hypothetical protein